MVDKGEGLTCNKEKRMELRERKSVGIVEMWGLDSGDEGAKDEMEEIMSDGQKSRRVSGGGVSCTKAKAVGGNRHTGSKQILIKGTGKPRGLVAMPGKAVERGSDKKSKSKVARRSRRQSGGSVKGSLDSYDENRGENREQPGAGRIKAAMMSGKAISEKNTCKVEKDEVESVKVVKSEKEEVTVAAEMKEKEEEEENVAEEARRMESDDDMLVDVATDATASVLSPTVWIKRPLYMNASYQGVYEKNENAPQEVPTSLHKDMNEAEKKTCHRRRSIGDNLENEVNNAEAIRMDGGANTVDHGYRHMQQHQGFDVAGHIEKEFEESQREQQDLKEIADIEADIARLQEMTKVLENSLAMKTGQVEELHGQNTSIKRMFSAIKVTRDDFNLEGLSQDQQREKMVDIGDRLVNMLRHGHNEMPLAQDKLNTPNPPPSSGQASLKEAKTAVTPPSSHPMESQIAAAALIAAKQDPARALVSLLEKSLEAQRRSKTMLHNV